jgi:hypothetical protein
MKISLDNGVTWNEAKEGVRVYYDGGEDKSHEHDIQFNLTEEGLIIDAYDKHNCVGTSGETLDDIEDRLAW